VRQLRCYTQTPTKTPQKGEFFGGIETDYPAWFKDSFLDFPEDLTEATSEEKRLVIFFHQDGCPYCNALVQRNFSQKEITEKAQKNFDIIAINMWGDRPVTHFDGQQYTEKTFAEKLKVQFTPTIIFFDEQGKVALRINGFKPISQPAKQAKHLKQNPFSASHPLTFQQRQGKTSGLSRYFLSKKTVRIVIFCTKKSCLIPNC